MDNNKILQQMSSIFSIFMVVFYLGVGSFMVFDKRYLVLDKAVRIIIGTSFIIYGIFRAFRTYIQIKEAFFNNETYNE